MSLFQKVMATVAKVMPDREPDELLKSHKYLGHPIDRIDGPLKVAGQAPFAAEVFVENLAYATLVASPIAHGKITKIDTQKAEQAPGVVRIFTHQNSPKMDPLPPLDPTGGTTNSGGVQVPVLSTDEISWAGQPVALIIAESQEQADHAASLVDVTYQELPATLSFEESKKDAKEPPNIMGEPTTVKVGDAEKALQNAEFSVDHTYTTPRHSHNAIEPHAVMAHWHDGKATVHHCSQFVQGSADTLAQALREKKGTLQVLSPFVGGGFGGKGFTWSHEALPIMAARELKRPVRLALSRKAVFENAGGRTLTEQRVALGARADGTFTSLIHTGVAANSFHNEWPEQFTFPARRLYKADTCLISQKVSRLNMVANAAMRAPGESIGTFALESAVDELSYKLNIDPIELRRLNEPKKDPWKNTPFSHRALTEAYRVGAERFGWRNRSAQPRSQQDGDWLVGQGCATAFYPVYRMPTSARVTFRADGTVRVQTATHEMGMGTATAQTQIAAERFGLPMHKIEFEYGNTDLPTGGMAGGSSQTISVAMAVDDAYGEVVKQLLKLAKSTDSPLAGCKPDDVEAHAEGLRRKDKPDQSETYIQLVARAKDSQVSGEVTTGAPLETMKYAMGSYGAQFCEVRVHSRTGELRIGRWLACFDTGRIINPKTARSQFHGGITMGIGLALMEETLYDERTGRLANPSLAEYHVPVHLDVPDIEIHFLDIPDPHTPLGAHGIGEIGITGCGAAVANAVYHATGKRIRDLPITLDKLM